MVDAAQTDKVRTSQTLPSIEVTSPDDLKETVHTLIWNDLPTYLQQAAKQHGDNFGDC